MKFKNTLLSLLRHSLTMAGGALAISPDPKLQALGIVLAALGSGWGAKDEHTAENPGAKSSGGASIVPLIAFAIVGALASVTFTGCVNAPGTSQLDPVKVEENTARLAKIASLAALTTEPGAASELQRISAGVDAVFARGTLTPQQINVFLDELKVEPKNRLLMAGLITELYTIFTDLTGQTLPDISHPLAIATLNGLKRGITEALALQAAVQPVAK